MVPQLAEGGVAVLCADLFSVWFPSVTANYEAAQRAGLP